MEIANSEDEYGAVAKAFHWIIAVCIIGLLPVGLGMGTMADSPLKFQVYAMHKSFGLLVLFLGIGRVIWRFASPPPEHLENHKRWERALAGAAHFWLYVCIFGMPLSGWLMSNAGEFPVPFFGVMMPALIGKNEQLGDLFYQAHSILAYTLLFVLALHIAGALKHHVIDKDATLQRITWRTRSLILPALIVLVAGASYALSALGFYKHSLPPQETPAPKAVSAPAAKPDNATLPPGGWAIVPRQSKLQFKASLYGQSFTAAFGQFGGQIVFDPSHLETAKADILIGMKNIATGDVERDQNIQGPDWFDSAKFPQSRFETLKFEHVDGDNYVAVGNLTLRGVTLPLTLPFKLVIDGKTAHATGHVAFDRVLFGVGTGQWEDGKTVARDVDVTIDVTAVRN